MRLDLAWEHLARLFVQWMLWAPPVGRFCLILFPISGRFEEGAKMRHCQPTIDHAVFAPGNHMVVLAIGATLLRPPSEYRRPFRSCFPPLMPVQYERSFRAAIFIVGTI